MAKKALRALQASSVPQTEDPVKSDSVLQGQQLQHTHEASSSSLQLIHLCSGGFASRLCHLSLPWCPAPPKLFPPVSHVPVVRSSVWSHCVALLKVTLEGGAETPDCHCSAASFTSLDSAQFSCVPWFRCSAWPEPARFSTYPTYLLRSVQLSVPTTAHVSLVWTGLHHVSSHHIQMSANYVYFTGHCDCGACGNAPNSHSVALHVQLHVAGG